MRDNLYWIEKPLGGGLAIAARPRAGDWLADEIAAWRRGGVDTVVSLLEAQEIAEIGLAAEPALCRAAGADFLSFPIADRGVPNSAQDVSVLADNLVARRASGAGVLIHCRAGIGRSALIAACALVVMRLSPEEAFDRIGRARGLAVPDTTEQREFVARFAVAKATSEL
jgi:protein-tyrosine phosphatase